MFYIFIFYVNSQKTTTRLSIFSCWALYFAYFDSSYAFREQLGKAIPLI